MIKTMHCSAAILDNDLCFLLVLYRLGEWGGGGENLKK